MKQRGQWGQTQAGPWEPLMVDAQALGGCEPVVCTEDCHCKSPVAVLRSPWAGN